MAVGDGVAGLVAEGRSVGVDREMGEVATVGLDVDTPADWIVGVFDEDGRVVDAGLDGVVDEVEIVGVVCADAWQLHTNATRTTTSNVLFIVAVAV
jgi:hypothetical protein